MSTKHLYTPPEAQGGPAMPQAQQPVDVEQVLGDTHREKGSPNLNYKTSIVDLMKLLDLDSILGGRKELAQEFGSGRARRQRRDEHLAPQGYYAGAGEEWRQGPGLDEGLTGMGRAASVKPRIAAPPSGSERCRQC
jgi:hypothetical protein